MPHAGIFFYIFFTDFTFHIFFYLFFSDACLPILHKDCRIRSNERKEENIMKKITKVLSFILAVLLTVTFAAGCQKSETPKTSGEQPKSEQSALSGTLQMAGSTSMEKIANALSESFMQKNSGVTVNAEFIGSSAGIEALASGSADIGNSSRSLKDSEKSQGIIENIVAIDGIAVITDKSNTVSDLTREQLTDIYTGKIKNWSELGGQSAAIVVIGREAGSGTRGAFEEILKIEDQCAYSNELDSTGAVLSKVASTPGSIGYVSLDVIDDSVNVFKLEGVEATAENIKAGAYFLQRPFVMATKGEISKQNDIVKAWFSYIDSDEGQAIIKKVGLISAK